jgi:uncharacterized PurR-regulated membrane protein YhhQ (DUF165 family)
MVLFLIIAAYVGVTLAANTYATTLIELPVFGVVGIGTLFFGATFTLRDWVHQFAHDRKYGRKPIYAMIGAAAGVNLLVALATSGEQFDVRIVGASVTAILIAESADTEIYQRLIKRNWYVRVAASNGVSAPLDSIIFTLLAFAGADYFPQELLIPVIFGDTLVKWAVGGLLALTKSVRDGAGAVLKGLNG